MSSEPTKHAPPPPPPARRAGGPPPPPAQVPGTTAVPAGGARFPIVRGVVGTSGERVLEYGPGGVGKTTLATLAPNPIVLDLEDSSRRIDTTRIESDHLGTWAALRACLQSSELDGFETIVIDSATKAEELALAHTLATVKHEKGHTVTSIEGYGFGKGYQHLYDTFSCLLADCDRHVRQGRNVVLVAHDCVNDVPNPVGDDFIRFEPALQQSRKVSIRERVIQWSDHVLFVGYDLVSQDGKAKGGGTRTIWPVERPTHRAKTRSALAEPLQYKDQTDGEVWRRILRGAA